VSATRPRRPPRRSPRGRRLALAGLVAVVFVVGIALGEALEQGGGVGQQGSQTIVRTLEPLSLVPVDVRTVTVTTPAP
jgi:hypothetical protein